VVVLLLGMSVTWASAALAVDPLPLQDTFDVSARRIGPHRVIVQFDVAPNYALYRDSITVRGLSAQVQAVHAPHGFQIEDPVLGHREVFRDSVAIDVRVPYAGEQERLVITSRTCLPDVVCYAPTSSTVTVTTAPP
jgi:thiol:disulfide interchange protein